MTLALAKFGPLLWGETFLFMSWAAIALNIAVGIGWILSFVRFLSAVDELQRKIMLDALAVTLGAGWIGGFAYVVADGAGLVPDDVNPTWFPVLLGVVFVIAFVAGRVRPR